MSEYNDNIVEGHFCGACGAHLPCGCKTTDKKLKPCPFCGCSAKKYGGGLSQETETVICSNCYAEALPSRWNTP